MRYHEVLFHGAFLTMNSRVTIDCPAGDVLEALHGPLVEDLLQEVSQYNWTISVKITRSSLKETYGGNFHMNDALWPFLQTKTKDRLQSFF